MLFGRETVWNVPIGWRRVVIRAKNSYCCRSSGPTVARGTGERLVLWRLWLSVSCLCIHEFYRNCMQYISVLWYRNFGAKKWECVNVPDCCKVLIATCIWSGGKRLLAGEQANLLPNGRCGVGVKRYLPHVWERERDSTIASHHFGLVKGCR